MRRRLMILLAVAGLYCLLLFCLWLLQDRLVFPGAGRGVRQIDAAGVRTVILNGDAGPFRVAECVPERPAAVLLFFVGNGEDLCSAGWRASLFGKHGVAVVCPEYPGYGDSPGRPGVESLLAVARHTAKHAASLAQEFGVPLVIGGISLGSFSAVHVAGLGFGERLFLAAPPTTMVDAAAARFWWLPVSWLLRHAFDNVAAAAEVRCPVLIVHGDADTIVPITLGERLAAAFVGPTEFVRVPGAGHNDLPLEAASQIGQRIGLFLRRR